MLSSLLANADVHRRNLQRRRFNDAAAGISHQHTNVLQQTQVGLVVEVDQYSRAMIGFCELLSAADQLSAASISIGINEYDLLSNGSKCREQFLRLFGVIPE